MNIEFDDKNKVFTINTYNTSYQMKIDKYGFLLHLYYGPLLKGSTDYLITYADRGFSGNPYEAEADRTYSLDILMQEYPCQGNGDYRNTALRIKDQNGAYSCDLRYKAYKIKEGKYSLPNLPAVYSDENNTDKAYTLEIIMEDAHSGLLVTLYYGVIPKYDIITRAERIQNVRGGNIVIEKAQTACIDFLDSGYDLITFYGRHAMERNLQRTKIGHGSTVIGSRRGTSSHQYNPFIIVAENETTEDFGGCYGLSFVYSGNFKAEAETDQYNQTRVTMGLQDELFSWRLKKGSDFYTPEVVMSYSANGLSRLSRNYHKLYRNNLCRGKYKNIERPVLINNWEATYFDFNGDKIYNIARQAAELGVEMFVLDDGWFGKRDDDNSGLGDWFVNEEKLKGTLSTLAKRINSLGMKFGLWVEPEMISEDSELYRSHEDYAFKIPGKAPVRSRNQLVLDFSRKEVVDCIYERICKVLDSANVEYIKWDMNRSITDVYSSAADYEGQGEILHRYMLGVYDFLERLNKRYPDLFIEGCSGGGGRFDAGMLYYTPQIWCSDNTDAIDRIKIQYGTSFGYPISCVGSHVSASPNHQTGRITSINTRGVVAMSGSFGYELDLNKISMEEKESVKSQIECFHKYWNVIHNGDYYRLTNPFKDEMFAAEMPAAWEFVTEDKKEALLNIVTLDNHGNNPALYIKLKGLLADAQYEDTHTKRKYYGSALMNAGISIPYMHGEYQAVQMHFVKCSV